MTEHTPPAEGSDTEALEEYAEEVGVDPTPQQVDQYLERVEGQPHDGDAAATDDPYGRTPGDAPDVAAEHDKFGYGDEQTGTANTVPDESVPRGRGGDDEPEGHLDGSAGPARI